MQTILKEAQRAGIEAARLNGGRYRGRKPSYSRAEFQAVKDMLGQGTSTSEIAKVTRLTRQTVLRIKADPVRAEVALGARGR